MIQRGVGIFYNVCDRIRRYHLRALSFCKEQQIFNIPLRSFDRRKIQPLDGKSERKRKFTDRRYDFQMNRTVSDDAFFPDLVFSGFKLRFDQADASSLRP